MANLTVRNLEEDIVRRLHEEAAREGVSTAEAHRRLLRRTLLDDPPRQKMSFKEYLMTIPEAGAEESDPFERQKDGHRQVEL